MDKRNQFEKLQDVAEKLGWNVTINEGDITIQRYTAYGQDFFFEIDGTGDILRQVEDYYTSFDPSSEALLWLDNDGHGKNGAPYEMGDVFNDMKECDMHLKNLYHKLVKEWM